jgi:hypothetical protein
VNIDLLGGFSWQLMDEGHGLGPSLFYVRLLVIKLMLGTKVFLPVFQFFPVIEFSLLFHNHAVNSNLIININR